MALDTYSGLKAAISRWSARSDLAADIDDLIDLAEARLNRLVRHPRMDATATATATSEDLALPADFVEMRAIRADGKILHGKPIDVVRRDYAGSGDVQVFAIVNNQILLGHAPTSAAIELDYYARIPALSDSNTANWLLTYFPAAYLDACLMEASRLTRNTTEEQKWSAHLAAVLGEIADDAEARNYGEATYTASIELVDVTGYHGGSILSM